jgi:predicted O-methyltransferase YrrM
MVVLLLLLLSSETLAIYILEEASSQNLPIDAALRRYAKHHERSYVNSDEYKSTSDVLRNIAVSQYRIDWQLRAAGVDCTPKNRVAFLQKGTPLECKGMDLQTKLECPTWAWTGLKEAFPNEEDLVKELRALMEPAPLDLRVNSLKCENRIDALRDIIDAGYDATSTPWSPIGIRLQERTALGKIPGLLDGIVEPQDEGSQLVASLLQAQPGEVVADYCAGSGGKTLQLAAAMQNKGRLYSMDVSEDRLERGKVRCKKAGVSNVQRQVVQEDMSRKDKWLKRRKGTFDRVLVDALGKFICVSISPLTVLSTNHVSNVLTYPLFTELDLGEGNPMHEERGALLMMDSTMELTVLLICYPYNNKSCNVLRVSPKLVVVWSMLLARCCHRRMRNKLYNSWRVMLGLDGGWNLHLVTSLFPLKLIVEDSFV